MLRRRAEEQSLLELAVELYSVQLRAGRHFLHEHPATASSWKTPAMTKLLVDPRVLETPPAKESTRFASSSEEVLKRLCVKLG